MFVKVRNPRFHVINKPLVPTFFRFTVPQIPSKEKSDGNLRVYLGSTLPQATLLTL